MKVKGSGVRASMGKFRIASEGLLKQGASNGRKSTRPERLARYALSVSREEPLAKSGALNTNI
jgi:hypothetical protein